MLQTMDTGRSKVLCQLSQEDAKSPMEMIINKTSYY